MMGTPAGLDGDIFRRLWQADPRSLPRWKAWMLVAARYIYVVGRDVLMGDITLHAMSLVYTTLLSIVPLLAISFSVLKGFGVHNQLQPLLTNVLDPLGEQGRQIAENIIGFVDNMNVGVLGAVGLAFLLWTVISLVQKIEGAFNSIWLVTQERSWARKFSDYLSVILLGPVLMFALFTLTTTLSNTAVLQRLIEIQPFGAVYEFVGRLMPYVLTIAAFTFLYLFIPNTRVRTRPAFIGALIAGVAWATAGWGFAQFVVSSSSKYTAIYSAFAGAFLFMIWLYLNWLILLVGGMIAFYAQHPEYLGPHPGGMQPSSRLKERLGLLIALVIARSFDQGASDWTIDRLASRLGVPSIHVKGAVKDLENAGLLTRTAGDPATIMPARPLEKILATDVIRAIRMADEDVLAVRRLATDEAVERVMADVDQAVSEAVGGITLKQLVSDSAAATESTIDRRVRY